MNQDHWTELEKAIRLQLELQVKLSFDRHHHFMLKHGLNRCKQVTDAGTGNGSFLEATAWQHPDITFIGIDDKVHMINEAKQRNEGNVRWIVADAKEETARNLIGESDGVIMRYFVLHMPDTDETIPMILSRAKPGTHLWVFDLDPDFTVCEPAEEAFDSFRALVTEFCDRQSVKIRIGRMLPPILESAGFKIEEVSAEPFNNREVDNKIFAEYLFREAYLYDQFIENTSTPAKLHEIKNFLFHKMKRETHFVQYGMAMISAVKSE